MTRRRLGPQGAAALAAAGSVGHAVELLSSSTYGHDVAPGQSLQAAQRAVVATAVWNLRVLTGWAPREGATVMRTLLAFVEIANTVAHLDQVAGRPVPPPYQLGGLATAWPRIREAADLGEVRRVLGTSAWGDPGGDSPRAVATSMTVVAADRVVALVPEAAAWAEAGTGLLLARELMSGRDLPPALHPLLARVLGPRAARATTVTELGSVIPRRAAWALAGVESHDQLWRAETGWWHRVERDGAAMVRSARPGRPVLVGAVATLATDAWRVRAALELAARGAGPPEDLDAVA
jgi:hypothetical protein